MATMRFGNSFANYRRGLILALLLGFGIDIALVFFTPPHQALVTNWPLLVLLPAIPFFPLVFISPTLLFSIHIEGGRVRHLFLDRYTLSDLPISDFEDLLLTGAGSGGLQKRRIAARVGFTDTDFDQNSYGPWAATLYFKHDRKIRFFGAHMRIMRSLKDALIATKAQE